MKAAVVAKEAAKDAAGMEVAAMEVAAMVVAEGVAVMVAAVRVAASWVDVAVTGGWRWRLWAVGGGEGDGERRTVG